MAVLVEHRMVAQPIPGQQPLFTAKSKTTRRTSPLVVTLGKLHTAALPFS